MQLVASAATGAAAVYVPVPALRYWWDKLAGFGVAGISKGHHDVRGACVTDLSRMITGRGRAGRREHAARRRAAASVVRAVAHSVTTSDERDERERSRA